MKKAYSLSSDCYVIPYEEKGPQSYIAYFPIQSLVFEVNEDAAEILRNLKVKPVSTADPTIQEFLESLKALKVINQEKEIHPFFQFKESHAPTRTILLLSDVCNLNCVYCYNNAHSKGEMMPFHIAKDAIDTIVKNAADQKVRTIELGYHGGGEPTMNWSVLTKSHDYARERSEENGLKMNSSICTNGVMTSEKAHWIVENIRDIAISIDGSPELHNRQRPFQNGDASFEKVASTIDLLAENKKNYALRITATEFSEGQIYDTVDFLINRFHPPNICIEPLFVCGRCETSGCKPPVDDHFIEEMIRAFELGERKKVSVQYSGNRITLLLSRFCGAQGSNFFVTSRGDVTSCLEVSNRNDSRADYFIYGRHDPLKKGFNFDYEKLKRLTDSQVQSFESCKDCFAKWHCGGDCLAKTPDFSNVSVLRNSYRCKINKALTRDSLIKAMNHQLELSKNSVPA